MASKFQIKIQYGDTRRRFNARKINGELDLDMVGLKAKVFSFFNLPPNADITMTCVDEDGETVTLDDDDHLKDVTRQRMKSLSIKVVHNSGSSTPMMFPRVQQLLPIVNAIAETLKSEPQTLREGLSIFLDAFASNATPMMSPRVQQLLPTVNALSETLKSEPQTLHEGLSIFLDAFASNAASASPGIAELVSFAKLGVFLTKK